MRVLAAWIAVNGLLLAGHVVAAAIAWAGSHMVLAGPAWLQEQWWAWLLLGLAAVASAVGFFVWVVRFAKFGGRNEPGR